MFPCLHRQYAQELLSTFSTTLGEVALVPATGGVFTVDILHSSPTSTSETDSEGPSDANKEVSSQLSIRQLWDRKAQGGFPGTKSLDFIGQLFDACSVNQSNITHAMFLLPLTNLFILSIRHHLFPGPAFLAYETKSLTFLQKPKNSRDSSVILLNLRVILVTLTAMAQAPKKTIE